MLPGPIFNIEMLTGARRTRFYWIRVIYAGVLLFALWTAFPTSYTGDRSLSIAELAGFAYRFFSAFSFLQIWVVLIVGPALVAPAVSVERERRTIEYLFATDLSNSEIVLGKLLARVLDLVYTVLVGLPVLALAGLLGGIDPESLLIAFIATASTILAVAALAIAVSVRAFRVRNALAQTYALLLGLLAIPIILKETLQHNSQQFASQQHYDWIAPINDLLLAANPLMLLDEMQRARYTQTDLWGLLGKLVLYQTILTVVLTLISVASVRRVQLKSAGSRQLRWLRRRHRAMTDRPMLWKELRENSLWSYGKFWWIAISLAVIGFVGPILWKFSEEVELNGWWRYSSRYNNFQSTTGGMLTFAICVVLLLAGVRAAGCITGEREKDTWITLLSTPLAARDIVRGKILANLKLALWLLPIWALVIGLRFVLSPSELLCVPFSLIVGTVLALFATALGTYISLASRTTMRAQATLMFALAFVAGGYLFCCIPFMRGVSDGRQLAFTLCAPFLIYVSMAIDHLSDEVAGQASGFIMVTVAGTLLFAFAAGVLCRLCEMHFDRLNQRITSPSESVDDTR